MHITRVLGTTLCTALCATAVAIPTIPTAAADSTFEIVNKNGTTLCQWTIDPAAVEFHTTARAAVDRYVTALQKAIYTGFDGDATAVDQFLQSGGAADLEELQKFEKIANRNGFGRPELYVLSLKKQDYDMVNAFVSEDHPNQLATGHTRAIVLVHLSKQAQAVPELKQVHQKLMLDDRVEITSEKGLAILESLRDLEPTDAQIISVLSGPLPLSIREQCHAQLLNTQDPTGGSTDLIVDGLPIKPNKSAEPDKPGTPNKEKESTPAPTPAPEAPAPDSSSSGLWGFITKLLSTLRNLFSGGSLSS